MTQYRVTSPSGEVHNGPFQLDKPDTIWFVRGIAYLTDEELARYGHYLRRKDYTIEQDKTPPVEHQQEVARMQAAKVKQAAHAVQDAADYPRIANQ